MSLRTVPTDALARRMPRLLRDERSSGVDFLLHLAEFDRRRAWAEGGHASLWEYCRRELKLLDCAIWRRVRCAKVLQSFPFAADYLRDGRYEMSTLARLVEILTPENAKRVLDSGAGKSREEIEALVADLRGPRPDVRESIRKLPSTPTAVFAALAPQTLGAVEIPRGEARVSERRGSSATASAPEGVAPTAAVAPLGMGAGSPTITASEAIAAPPTVLASPTFSASPTETRRPDFEALGNERWALRMTVDRKFRDKLERARAILSHAEPSGSLVAVLERALDKVIAEHDKRVSGPARKKAERPALRPEQSEQPEKRGKSGTPETRGKSETRENPETPGKREKAETRERQRSEQPEKRENPQTPKNRRAGATTRANAREHIPIDVEREVRWRDRDRCAWKRSDGTACGSTWQVEIDHFVSPHHGGENTVENLRLLCRAHNEQHARNVFGDAAVERHKRGDSPGKVARREMTIEGRAGRRAVRPPPG